MGCSGSTAAGSCTGKEESLDSQLPSENSFENPTKRSFGFSFLGLLHIGRNNSSGQRCGRGSGKSKVGGSNTRAKKSRFKPPARIYVEYGHEDDGDDLGVWRPYRGSHLSTIDEHPDDWAGRYSASGYFRSNSRQA